MLLFVIQFFFSISFATSPFLNRNDCNENQTFVINELDGASCHYDEMYIKNSMEHMFSMSRYFELVPSNISEHQEFICKVNFTQYSDVFIADSMHETVPIVCHVPEVIGNSYTDVEIWSYKPSTGDSTRMKVEKSIVTDATHWEAYINHVQFSRSEDMAGLKGAYGSIILRWKDEGYNPCSLCKRTSSGVVFDDILKAEKYCQLNNNYCTYSDFPDSNCTGFDGGECFEISAL